MTTLVGCPVPDNLADEAMALVDRIRACDGDMQDVSEITDVICRLTETSLDYYFTRPVRELGAGRTLLGVVNVGNRGALKMIRGGMQQVLSRLQSDQILQVADYIEECFYEI